MRIEYREYIAQELRIEGDSEGRKRLSWYASVFDSLSEDLGGFREKIGRRAFTDTVQNDDIRALFNHDPNFVLGRNRSGTLNLRVDLTGLRAEVVLPNTRYADDLAEVVARGDVSGGSFAFSIEGDDGQRWYYDEDGTLIREVRKVRLYDVSPVVFPAYPGTNGSAFIRSLGVDQEELARVIASLQPEPPVTTHEPRIPISLRRRQLELARLHK